jgi:hypothetical protein
MSDNRTYKKEARRAPLPTVPDKPLSPPGPLSDADIARIQETKAFVTQNMPDMIPIIKDLVDQGVIHGWRNVTFTEEKK